MKLEDNFYENININKNLYRNNNNFPIENLGENNNRHIISIAPMMAITDNYYRSFVRLLTQNATLYTEMIHTDCITKSKRGYLNELFFEENHHPIVIQLGGNDPIELGKVSTLCKEMGYDEINLNCGCPSSKVQKCSFGAVLMDDPNLVAECVNNIQKNSNFNTTIKCRLGLNEYNQNYLDNFIDILKTKGNINHFIMHARIALMNLSTDQNRKIPPLQYKQIYSLKKNNPNIKFSLNGGIKTLDEAEYYLTNDILNNEKNQRLEGIMIGRAAYENPWILTDIDERFYGKKNLNLSKKEVVYKYADYIDKVSQQIDEVDISHIFTIYNKMVKPLTYLFHGEKGTSEFKKNLLNISAKNQKEDFSIYEHIIDKFEKFEKRNPEGANKKAISSKENEI
jgi:tRNA-dihydrouridine synthase A